MFIPAAKIGSTEDSNAQALMMTLTLINGVKNEINKVEENMARRAFDFGDSTIHFNAVII